MSVAPDQESLPEAQRNVDEARSLIESMGFEVKDSYTPVGNPIDEIIEQGQHFSLIVLSDTGRVRIETFFPGQRGRQGAGEGGPFRHDRPGNGVLTRPLPEEGSDGRGRDIR